jgi:hypothetical protein
MGHWATEITSHTDRLTALNTTKTKLDGLVTFFTNLPAGTTKEELSTALENSTNKNDPREGYEDYRDEEVDSYVTWDADQAAVDAHIAERLATFTTAQTEIVADITSVTNLKTLAEAKEDGTADPAAEHKPI